MSVPHWRSVERGGSVEGHIVQIVRNIPISCGPGIVKFEHASCHGIVFLVPSSTLDKETAVLKDLTTAHRAADLGLWVSAQNLTVVPVVEPKTLGRASFSGGGTSGAFLTTPPLHNYRAASPATSYPTPTRHGLLGQVVVPLPRSLVFVDDVTWVLHRTTGPLPAMTIRRINVPERKWRVPSFGARSSLALYVKTKGKYKEVEELEGGLTELERVRGKTEKQHDAGLWNASVWRWRAGCALGAGDVEGAVGDWTRLSHLLAHIFHLAHPYLPPPPTLMATLKQSLHFDPDSEPGLSLRRLGKSLDKSFFALDELLVEED
ncbi:hypothetical protein BJ165DRAFT_1613484 [Panaeolus papilionaceus]|nr:hypothetical protein BJ165DRAFT_1613484 [Panaeolus papilionaceus]